MELPYRIKLWQRLWHRIVTVIDNSKIDGIDEREREVCQRCVNCLFLRKDERTYLG